MEEKALEYLCRDTLLNIDMIECLRRGLCKTVRAGEDGVLLTVDEGSCAMLSCGGTEQGLALVQEAEFEFLVIHQMQMKEALCRKYSLKPGDECWQAAYLKTEPLKEQAYDIRRLDCRYTGIITRTYHSHDGEYIGWLTERGLMYGIFDRGELAGFIGRHAEGSIGLLEVFPDYRRRGFGEALERRYVNMELREGHVPYGQVFVGNEKSRKLQEKLGMAFAAGRVCWLWKA